MRLQHKVHVLQINHLYITLDLSPFLHINTLSESVYVSRYFQTFSHHRHTQESTTESSTSTTSRENPSSLNAAIDEGFDELEDHEQLSTDRSN